MAMTGWEPGWERRDGGRGTCACRRGLGGVRWQRRGKGDQGSGMTSRRPRETLNEGEGQEQEVA